jgi:hypothetical protein
MAGPPELAGYVPTTEVDVIPPLLELYVCRDVARQTRMGARDARPI